MKALNEFIHKLTIIDVWALFIALGWLLPNHYLPWITFHTDGWIAWMMAIAGAGLIFRIRHEVEWTSLIACTALTATIPILQYATGLLPFSGQAWVSSAYLIGFTICILIGYRWEKIFSGQAANSIFIAISFACLISVGMQLYQWLSLDGLDLWIVYMAGNRPFANLVQPNQLATFLFWGLVCTGWFTHRNKISMPTAVLMSMFFLFGIALTRSRTATFAIIFSLAAAWHWRALWYSKIKFQILIGLLLFFVASQLSIGFISNALLLSQPFDEIARIAGTGLRLDAYKLFVDAAMQRPIFGYGWTNLGAAQMLVAEHHVQLNGIFQHTHNLFLDLILWAGIPIGLILSVFLLHWFYIQYKTVVTVEDALLLLFVGSFWWHAMLELPHQYAYMLLPIGIIMGTQEARNRKLILFRTHYLTFTFLWAVTTALLTFITYDYFKMEADFQALRFERSYGMQKPVKVPETFVLSQLEAFIKMGRMKARPGMSHEDIEWMHKTADSFPSPANQYAYIAALALNDQPDLAKKRMRILQKVMSTVDYEELGNIWESQSKVNLILSKTEWLPVVNQ